GQSSPLASQRIHLRECAGRFRFRLDPLGRKFRPVCSGGTIQRTVGKGCARSPGRSDGDFSDSGRSVGVSSDPSVGGNQRGNFLNKKAGSISAGLKTVV